MQQSVVNVGQRLSGTPGVKRKVEGTGKGAGIMEGGICAGHCENPASGRRAVAEALRYIPHLSLFPLLIKLALIVPDCRAPPLYFPTRFPGGVHSTPHV